ncbi:MAG TPA: sigma-70 family RNA polymerase sigma factor, partial [Polyangiaceae bacterium]|nr:sigma-70 family RNA polymerase sigma factor [Polyangiaceae bacterium]
PADAEDAAQDVFWVFARRLNDVPLAAERAFLISTALHIAADKRRTKWYSVSFELDVDARLSESPLPDEALDLRRAHAMLDSVLDGLPASERDVFVLSDIEELSRSEVARSLAISEGTVASRLARARERVEAALKRLCAKRGRRP